MHPACTVVSCMICINIPTMQVSAKIAAITRSQAIGAAVASVQVAKLHCVHLITIHVVQVFWYLPTLQQPQ